MAPSQDDLHKETIRVLLESLNDKEDVVNSAIIKSLNKISASYPQDVVTEFCELYKKSPKMSEKHLSNIIKVLEQTCVNKAKSIDKKRCEALVECMLHGMTTSLEPLPAVQLGASAVLIALSHHHYDLVLRSLISSLSLSSVPHYTVPHSLGRLAAVNTLATVPHVKELLGYLVPLVPHVRSDATRQAFAYAFGHFAVAVSEQIGDNVENDNITAIKDNFVLEFTNIFDTLFNQWLHSHEPKVAESVLEALGPLMRLISERKFTEIINKFVTTLLSMYRRSNINHYIISQCISYLLSPSPLNPKLNLSDHVLNSINTTLFQLVLLEPDYDNPHSVKNHFEVLRCFDHMAEHFPDITIDFLLNNCKINQEKDRVRSVIILTHLTTSSQNFVDSYSAKFISILKVMIAHEHNLKMKKVLVKAIVGLVYRNCFSNDDDFVMIDFIVKHCSCERSSATNSNEIDDLEDTCKSSLYLLSNTVTNVKNQLCNLLLKSLLTEEFVGAVTTVTQCLTSLLQNQNEKTEENNEKPIRNEVPTELIFVRCLILLIDPKNSERNKNVLVFLECYSDIIHKNLKLSSNVEVQRMIKYVDNNESEAQWHSMLRDLLISSIDQVNSAKWLETLSMLLSQQILAMKQDPVVKGVSLQYLAILSCHMTNTVIAEKILNVILQSIRTTSIQGCPFVNKAVGIASRKYGDYVLNELDLMYKEVDGRKGNKFFNFISKTSKTESEANTLKLVLISCYGKVAKECMDEHVLARLGENVTAMINDVLKTYPNLDLTFTSLTALYEIAKALHPAPHHSVILRNRWQLLNVVLEQLFNRNLDNRNVELFPIIVKASKALTKLQKGILPEERNTILRHLFDRIFDELSLLRSNYEKDGNEARHDFLAKTLNDSLNLLRSLIQELVIQSTCLSLIDDLIGLLLGWLHHENDDIRAAAVNIMHVVFDTYIKNVKLNYETPSKFGQMGYLLGLLAPKTTDSNFAVRLATMDNIKLVIQIEDLYDGHTIEVDDPCMNALTEIHNGILTNDSKMITDFSTKLSKTISEKIPQHQLLQFVESILESFEDKEYSSIGISAVLNELFKQKGSDLYQNIERIVEVILSTMDNILSDRRLRLLGPVASLAHHHANAVIAVLLSQPLPLKPCVSACWRHLARDCVLSLAVVENFLRILTSVQLFEDPYHITENHIAALQPLTLITALGEMLSEGTMRQLCLDKFADLFSVLYTTVACYGDALPPAYVAPHDARQQRFGFVPNREAARLSPARIALSTFGAFLQQANCQKVQEACALYTSGEERGGWACPELAPLLAGALCREAAPYLQQTIATLAPYARSPLPPHRAATIALFAQVLHYRCNDNGLLVETVMGTLVSGCADGAARVRAAALRGLAGAARLGAARRDTHLPAALASLSQGLDMQHAGNASENIPLAAMQGLCHLLTDLDPVDPDLHRDLVSIAQKTRPFMNTEEAVLREHSIKLFGVVVDVVRTPAMQELAVGMMTCFLMHLCDDDAAVVRASKLTLKRYFGALGPAQCNSLVQTHLLDSGQLMLDRFLPALVRQVAREAPQQLPRHARACAAYLVGARDSISAHAALLTGVLYSESPRCVDVEWEQDVCRDCHARLVRLLTARSAEVRQYAAFALPSVCLALAHFQAGEIANESSTESINEKISIEQNTREQDNEEPGEEQIDQKHEELATPNDDEE